MPDLNEWLSRVQVVIGAYRPQLSDIAIENLRDVHLAVLSFDSLDLTTISLDLEDKFGILIDVDQIASRDTLNDLAELLCEADLNRSRGN